MNEFVQSFISFLRNILGIQTSDYQIREMIDSHPTEDIVEYTVYPKIDSPIFSSADNGVRDMRHKEREITLNRKMILFIRLLIRGILTRLFICMIDATVQIDDDIIPLIFIALLVNVVLFLLLETLVNYLKQA